LAEQLIRLAGKEPDQDIDIVYSGLRPGEKLFEELFHEHEAYANTAHEKIFLARNADQQVHDFDQNLHRAEHAVRNYESSELRKILTSLVPELGRVPPKDQKVVPLG
ncbi:MAG: polysaccharide biosynthesis protein, partial [Pseudomonadota bacterium]